MDTDTMKVKLDVVMDYETFDVLQYSVWYMANHERNISPKRVHLARKAWGIIERSYKVYREEQEKQEGDGRKENKD